MTVRCARCDFHPDPADPDLSDREQLAEHALAASHPLCPCCGTSLTDGEPINGCERCLSTAREHLAGIRLLFDELPTHLGHTRSPAYDSDRPTTSDGRPLPGGDVLVLLGPGSEGLSEDGHTSKDGDPTSVAFELGWWEKDLRETRDDPDPGPPRSAAAVVRSAAGYLEVHARWAANNHPGFPELAADLRRLHGVLERATGRGEIREVAEAECLTCGHRLIRRVTDRGYDDGYTCEGCKREYRRPGPEEKRHDEYAIALKQHFHFHPQEWAPADLIREWHPTVSPELLRQWKKRGQVATAVRYEVTLYRVADVVARLEARSA